MILSGYVSSPQFMMVNLDRIPTFTQIMASKPFYAYRILRSWQVSKELGQRQQQQLALFLSIRPTTSKREAIDWLFGSLDFPLILYILLFFLSIT